MNKLVYQIRKRSEAGEVEYVDGHGNDNLPDSDGIRMVGKLWRKIGDVLSHITHKNPKYSYAPGQYEIVVYEMVEVGTVPIIAPSEDRYEYDDVQDLAQLRKRFLEERNETRDTMRAEILGVVNALPRNES